MRSSSADGVLCGALEDTGADPVMDHLDDGDDRGGVTVRDDERQRRVGLGDSGGDDADLTLPLLEGEATKDRALDALREELAPGSVEVGVR